MQTWDKWTENCIEKIHLQFLKRILGINRSTTNLLVIGELDRHILQVETVRRSIKYLNYVHQKDDTGIVKQSMKYEFERKGPCRIMSTLERHLG